MARVTRLECCCIKSWHGAALLILNMYLYVFLGCPRSFKIIKKKDQMHAGSVVECVLGMRRLDGCAGSLDTIGDQRGKHCRNSSHSLFGNLHDFVRSPSLLLRDDVVDASAVSQQNASKEFWIHVWAEGKRILHDLCRLSVLGSNE
jgi:hypothetical protein